MKPDDPAPRAARKLFWTSFGAMAAVLPMLAVAHEANQRSLQQNLVVALLSIAAVLLPAWAVAAIVSRPLRVHAARGPRIAFVLVLLGLSCGTTTALLWLTHPPADPEWPITRALWESLGDAHWVMLPVFLLTIIADVFVMGLFEVGRALAPAFVPALGVLAGVFVAWLVSAIVIRVLDRARLTSR